MFILFNATFCLAEEAKDSGKKSTGGYLKADTTEFGVNFTSGPLTASARPFIGYFVSDEIEVGGGFMVETGDVESKSYTTTALTLLGRYNVPMEQNMAVFGELGIEQVNVDKDVGSGDSSLFLIGVGGRVFPSKNFCLNFTCDYVIGNYENNGKDYDTNALRLGLGLSVFVF